MYIIVDDAKICEYIQEVGSWIWWYPVRILRDPGEYIAIDQYDERIIVIPSDILRISGNLESIKRGYTIEIQRNSSIGQSPLIENLLEYGYRQSDFPWESGTYTREGSIIRIWKEDREYLIEYFDDTIESIIETSPWNRVHRDRVLLARETPYESTWEHDLSREMLEAIQDTPIILIGCEFLREREYLHANIRDITEYSSLTREGSTKLDITRVDIDTLPAFLSYTETHGDSGLVSITRYEKRLQELIGMNPATPIPVIEYRHIEESFTLTGYTDLLGQRWKAYMKSDRFTLMADDIFGQVFVQNRVRKSTIKHLDLLLKIAPWDLIVHREHGIGRYIQILKKRIWLIEREYMEVEYQSRDKVYVPMTELARITKYVGGDDTTLSNLAGKEWERVLSKTDEEVEAIAADILETDAKRSITTRIPFGVFEEEEKFEKGFQYTHTSDQLEIIREIRRDMESPHPMDRLIAWDVGFGKTEVAMNAAYKAVLSGTQVAVISPLLILAEEHRETFEERLWAYGVRVRSLTRMTHKREVDMILEEIRLGRVDVVVGTHRLLSEDIRFRRLGLLVIDEEHRFGVAQKEAIRRMKAHVDILSLSATPIPRSLHLALSGLKKISLLTTPPPSKKPIDTIVTRWEEHTVKSAIESELARGGQVIILHNRVRSLPMIEREIEEMMQRDGSGTQVRITTTHGQMNPDDIEDRILAFKQGKYDILISTTVIENGVNFLGANTILVSDAEEFGLAQLHQIRGRVGRRDVAWVCYLLYRKYELSSEERERLMILAEHSALGSGYEIAMRDMQMRGTWDILGWRQSGKTKEVGISLYFQLLEEKVSSMRDGKRSEHQCKIDLELSYVIEDDAFDSQMDKLSFFRDIESIDTLEDLDYAESTFLRGSRWEDRENLENTSDISMSNLFLMMRISIILKGYGVSRISKMGQSYHFDFATGTTPVMLRAFLERFDTKRDMIIVSIERIRVEVRLWKSAREFIESLI